MTTQNDQNGDRYIKMMWGQITISLAIFAAVITMFVNLSANDVLFSKDFEHLKNWTNEVYRWEILPTEELSQANAAKIIIVIKRLEAIDSINYFQERHINQLYNWERERQGMAPMEGAQ